MTVKKPIQIVDLFAGPGGLGEGFASLQDKFEILVSAEMDQAAHRTLTLRAFYRQLMRSFPQGLKDYYQYCKGTRDTPWSDNTAEYWEKAENEARRIELGTENGNDELDRAIDKGLDKRRHWVLIGGPPCQAYSLVGRARNKGISGYNAEGDHRHFLYKEYLRIIQKYSPSIFVMENVKGILSSRVNGIKVFNQILTDLSCPSAAFGMSGSNEKYVICSLSSGEKFYFGDDPSKFDSRHFVVRAEEYGVPQCRHRVILIGIKASLFKKFDSLDRRHEVNVCDVISDLPELRSKISRGDNEDLWFDELNKHIEYLLKSAGNISALELVVKELGTLKKSISRLPVGELSQPSSAGVLKRTDLNNWLTDKRLKVILNHEARGHMTSDLRRYLFAAVYAKVFKKSPKGPEGFCLPGLAPNHKNWASGKFSDRFRVQLSGRPSTTVTSHISKDGHYFIHPDPKQCRSLSVREAARLQTFPDNYFFQGNKTQQYHQAGNAVPPYLARQIAERVYKLIGR